MTEQPPRGPDPEVPPPYPPGQPPGQRQGLSTGCIVALVVVGLILLVFGVCVATLFGGSGLSG